jgi:dolichol kinase
MIPFALTPIDIIGLITIGLCVFFYFRTYLKKKPLRDHLDELFCCIIFIWATFNIFLLINVYRNYNDNVSWTNAVCVLVYGIFIILVGLILVCTLIAKIFGKMGVLNARRDKYRDDVLTGVREKKPVFQDFMRKGTHIAFFVILFVVCYVAEFVFAAIYPGLVPEYGKWFWEIRPNGDFFYATFWQQVDTNPDIFKEIGIMHNPLFFAFYIGFVISMFLDWIRFSTRFWALGRNTVIKFSRKAELDKIPSFIPFFAGILGLSVFIPPLPMLAIMGCVIFADTATSQIGIRYGKHKIPWNKSKSWEGAIAGCITALITWLFVGPLWAIISVICFFIGDTLTEKPVKLSDNLFTPLVIGMAYLVLLLLHVPYVVPAWAVIT